MKIEQVSRQEIITANGAEVIRVFIVTPYSAHKEVVEELLMGVNGKFRTNPARDSYYQNFFCNKVEVKNVDDTAWANGESLAIKEDLSNLKNPTKEDTDLGGAIIVAHYNPIISIGDATNWFNFTNYTQTPFTQQIAIPKGALIDLDTTIGYRKGADDDVKLFLNDNYYSLSFTRMGVPYARWSEERAIAEQLVGKINEDDGFMWPGAASSPVFAKHTLRFDGVSLLDKVAFNNGADSAHCFDITYNWTWRVTYDEYWLHDGSSEKGWVGWNRTLMYPGIVLLNKGVNFNIGWYGYGWRKERLVNPFDTVVSPPYISDKTITPNGFYKLFENFAAQPPVPPPPPPG